MNPGTKVSSKATFLRGRASPSLVRSLIIPRSNPLKAASMCIINRPHAPEMSRLSRRLRRYRNDCRVSRRSVNLLQGGQFDVLGSDIGMPRENGYSFIKRVRSLSAASCGDIPAIALTAYARVEDRVMAIAASFQMHIAKPVEPIELVTMIAGARGLSIKSQAAAEQ